MAVAAVGCGDSAARARPTMRTRVTVQSANKLSSLPEPKRSLVYTLVQRLSRVEGVVAQVLGGSYARGSNHAESDVDLGLYYEDVRPFSIEAIRGISESVSAGGKPTVTDFYEWGAWVNGGAWLHTSAGKVDLLYRNLDQVRRTIDDAHRGLSEHDYDQQPTHGFYGIIYLAETADCLPLHDPGRRIAGLKTMVAAYPPLLRERIVADSLWAAEFTLSHARSFAQLGDAYNTVGCLTRVSACLTQCLFAVNERYFPGDKAVMKTIAGFQRLPAEYVRRTNRILSRPGETAGELTATVARLAELWSDVSSLPGVRYEPRFEIG